MNATRDSFCTGFCICKVKLTVSTEARYLVRGLVDPKMADFFPRNAFFGLWDNWIICILAEINYALCV